MTMHIYALVEDGCKMAEQISPVWGASKLRFSGDWYAARADCFRHAIEHGHTGICIVAHTVQLYRRPHGGTPQRMDAREQHGLWLYLDRLLRRYGHAYVPPLAWARMAGQHEYFNNPTIPLVAAYSVRALQEVDPDTPAIGYQLCCNGYDSFTLNDYFFFNHSGKPGLDEAGSAATWKDAYERAISRVIGPSRRLAQFRQEAVRTGRR